MIMDSRLEFCDATALNTGGAATYLLGNVVDLGNVTQDIGNGESTFLVISVDTLPVSATGTIDLQLASDAQAAIATDGSATVHLRTGARLAAAMPVGPLFMAELPTEYRYERYLGILQTTAVAAFSAGKINAYITLDKSLWTAYADATN